MNGALSGRIAHFSKADLVAPRTLIAMKLNAVKPALVFLLVNSIAALAATEEKLHQQFPVQPGGTVVMEVDFGSINVSTNAISEVVVDVWRKIGRKNKADEEAFLRENPVTLTHEGNTVTIRSRGKASSSWSWSGRNQNEAKYTITVPARFDARLKSGGGGIEVVDLTGEMRAQTGGGGLSFTRLNGPLNGETGGGGIRASACEGKLAFRTGGGGMEVTGGSGSLDGKNGGGSVTIKEFQGSVHVSTGGGGITVEKVQGAVEATTGGGSISAVLPSELSDTVKLSTGGGGINVSVPATAAFGLDATTAGGKVSTELSVAVVGKMEDGRLKGPVNGGGKAVELRSGGGSIHLKKI
jgi:DUF4097 and DUF4098 domain-containing protein YvlB